MSPVAIGSRLRELREQKGLSQTDLERLTGIKSCYTSRVEHGHTVPGLENLERYAAGIGVPMYRLFYDGDEPPPLASSTPLEDLEELAKDARKKNAEARFFLKLRKALAKVGEPDRGLFLAMVRKLAAPEK
jgi:transcriptional regulator with XRE-family HTH domain